jgi:protein TonB
MRKHLEGEVLLRVRVGTDGLPLAVEIARSSGHRVLDDAARRTVLAQWRFRPAMRDGLAVQAVGLVPIVFRLSRG